MGENSSIIIGSDGLGLISYTDITNQDLKIVHCDNITCSYSTNHTLDSTGEISSETSITIGVDGLGVISYRSATDHCLKVAHCNTLDCSSATIFTLDSFGNTGWNSSIAIGADGLGIISYTNGDYDLMVAHCSNELCIPINGSYLP